MSKIEKVSIEYLQQKYSIGSNFPDHMNTENFGKVTVGQTLRSALKNAGFTENATVKPYIAHNGRHGAGFVHSLVIEENGKTADVRGRGHFQIGYNPTTLSGIVDAIESGTWGSDKSDDVAIQIGSEVLGQRKGVITFVEDANGNNNPYNRLPVQDAEWVATEGTQRSFRAFGIVKGTDLNHNGRVDEGEIEVWGRPLHGKTEPTGNKWGP